MDEIVLKSMAKWPDVPDVYGWIALDRRGNWRIKDERILNPAIGEFISRNYDSDERGRWFFQNGPQRVFVSLAYAPFVLSTQPNGVSRGLVTQTGASLEQLTGAWIDENGIMILRASGGEVGSVCDRDLAEITNWFTNATGQALDDDVVARAADRRAAHGATGIWLEYGNNRLPVGRVNSEQIPTKFGFDRSPRPEPGQSDC
jgi:hypothetical protein